MNILTMYISVPLAVALSRRNPITGEAPRRPLPDVSDDVTGDDVTGELDSPSPGTHKNFLFFKEISATQEALVLSPSATKSGRP